MLYWFYWQKQNTSYYYSYTGGPNSRKLGLNETKIPWRSVPFFSSLRSQDLRITYVYHYLLCIWLPKRYGLHSSWLVCIFVDCMCLAWLLIADVCTCGRVTDHGPLFSRGSTLLVSPASFDNKGTKNCLIIHLEFPYRFCKPRRWSLS